MVQIRVSHLNTPFCLLFYTDKGETTTQSPVVVSIPLKKNEVQMKSYDDWCKVVNTRLSQIDQPTWGTYREIAKEFDLSFAEVWEMSGNKDYFDFVECDDDQITDWNNHWCSVCRTDY